MRGETGPDSGVRTQRRTLGPNTLGKILSSPVLTRKNYPAAFSQIAFSEYLANTVQKRTCVNPRRGHGYTAGAHSATSRWWEAPCGWARRIQSFASRDGSRCD